VNALSKINNAHDSFLRDIKKNILKIPNPNYIEFNFILDHNVFN